jgi:hypothetical protein
MLLAKVYKVALSWEESHLTAWVPHYTNSDFAKEAGRTLNREWLYG